MKEAFAEWAQHAGISGECSDNPEIELMIIDGWPDTDERAGNAVVYADGMITTKVVIEVQADYGPSVLRHEMGHALGLAHSDDETAAMFHYPVNPINATDIANIQSIYGPRRPLDLPYRVTVPGLAK